jgi:prenyltransferase beta subunit
MRASMWNWQRATYFRRGRMMGALVSDLGGSLTGDQREHTAGGGAGDTARGDMCNTMGVATQYVLSSRAYDGGIGLGPGQESHGGST